MNPSSLCEPLEGRGFIKSFTGLIGCGQIDQMVRSHHSGMGRRGEVSAHRVVMALVYHFFEPGGYLSAHFSRLWKQSVSDAALSKRRLVMGYKVTQWRPAWLAAPVARRRFCFALL